MASSMARSGTTSTSATCARITAKGATPMSRTAIPSAIVLPPTDTGWPDRRWANAA